jgi:hypothetical protein
MEFLRDFGLGSPSLCAFSEVAPHAGLKFACEDSLFELICGQIPSDSRFFGVLQFVRLDLHSVAKIVKSFGFVCTSFDWTTVRTGYCSGEVSPLIPNRLCSKPPPDFPHRSFLLDRITLHWTSKFGGNEHDRGVVTVTANRVVNDNPINTAKSAADIGMNSYLCSASELSQSISGI